MCTKDETAQVLEHEFFKSDGLKDRLMVSFRTELDSEIGKFTRKQIWGLIGIVIAAAAGWFSLYYQVQGNTNAIKADAENGFTQNEAALIKQQNLELKEDVGELKDAFIRLDDRLRAKGI